MTPPKTSRRSALLGNLGALLVSLLLLEGVLQVASLLVPRVGQLLAFRPPQVLIPDARFRMRGNPEHPDLDDWGYRNPRGGRDHPDLVTMGDSQTFGLGVEQAESWPAVLAGRLGIRVYNMAIGSFG